MSIRIKKKSKNFFITSSNAMTGNRPNATTVSSSHFTQMSQSFVDGEYLIDDAIRKPFGSVIYMLQEMQSDVDDIYTQISASQYSPLDNSQLQATTGSFDRLEKIIGGTTNVQNTGSFDFPGAIVGYNVQGLNVTHASYNLTTTMAVPDAGMYVQFQAPKSGIVEIEVQVLADGGSSGTADLVLGLSDAAIYNTIGVHYEQGVLGFPRFDHMEVVHKWVVPSLTPGTTYKYWLGAKSSNTTGTPQLRWGGSSTGRFSDFIMKATALPSNTEIET